MQELRYLSKISKMQSQLDVIDIEISELSLRDKYIKKDLKNIVRKRYIYKTETVYLVVSLKYILFK